MFETVQIVSFGFWKKKKAISVNFRTWDLKKISRPFLWPHTCHFVMRISFWIRANILQKKMVKKQKEISKLRAWLFLNWRFFVFDDVTEKYIWTEIFVNRYRRGLKTLPQAKTSKSGHAIFFSFFRRVRATSMTQCQVENTRVLVDVFACIG